MESGFSRTCKSACTFYLVFKEPDVVPDPRLRGGIERRYPSALFPSGEPFKSSEAALACQPPAESFFRRRLEPSRRPIAGAPVSDCGGRASSRVEGLEPEGKSAEKKFAQSLAAEQIFRLACGRVTLGSFTIRPTLGAVNSA